MATLTPSPECGSLRRLIWADPPAVDLLVEFPWIVAEPEHPWEASRGEDPAEDTEKHGACDDNVKRKMKRDGLRLKVDENGTVREMGQVVEKSRSPYKQILVPAKAVHPPLSPAQRAGKKMLQIKTELQSIVAPASSSVKLIERPQGGGLLGLHQLTDYIHTSQVPASIGQKSPTRKQTSTRSPVPTVRARMSSPLLSPAEIDLMEKQKRLAAWILKNSQRVHTEGHARDDVGYSQEICARVHAAVMCKDDYDGKNDALWMDPVRSLLAAEVTSETVFGGFIPTRRLAYQPPGKQSSSVTAETGSTPSTNTSPLVVSIDSTVRDTSLSSPAKEPPSIDFIAEKAQDIRLQAGYQVIAGNIEDALVTLDTGIQQIMYEYQDNHEELRRTGFNYSVTAHQLSTKLQLCYRLRHNKRVRSAVLLQRAWHRFRRLDRFRLVGNYEDAHAATIQRLYKRRYHQILCTRSAVRIQKCFRVYQFQKNILHFHQACRLLLERERHRREVAHQVLLRKKRMWSKLKIVLRFLQLWTMRRRSITSLQKRWRGGRCRVRYTEMLNALREAESERRKREDAFVARRLDTAVPLYSAFLHKTRRGQKLVRSHGELPWARFRRLQFRNGPEGWVDLPVVERIELLDRMYNGRRVNEREWRIMACQLSLGHRIDVKQSHQQKSGVEISSSGLQFLLDGDSPGAIPIVIPQEILGDAPKASVSPRKKSRWMLSDLGRPKRWLMNRMAVAKQKLDSTVVNAGWRTIYYPRAYYWHHRFWTRKAQASTRDRLENDFKRLVSTFMRKQFRASSGNRPRFECAECYEPFATAKELFVHSRGETATGMACVKAKQHALVEWNALMIDANSAYQRHGAHSIVWNQILQCGRLQKRSSGAKHTDLDVMSPALTIPYRDRGIGPEDCPRWRFTSFKLTPPVVREIYRQGDGTTVKYLAAIAFRIASFEDTMETSGAEIPLELVGYVFQTLGGFRLDEGGSISQSHGHPYLLLLRTALYQLVTWNTQCQRSDSTPSGSSPTTDLAPLEHNQAITVAELRSLFASKPSVRHSLRAAQVANSSKDVLHRCQEILESCGKRLRGASGRKSAYHQSILQADGSQDSTARPASRSMTVTKRAGQGTTSGSAIVTAPSVVVPVTT